MTIHLVELFYPNVFKRYYSKYNIFRELYEKDLVGLEVRQIDFKFSQKIKQIVLSKNEICYTSQETNRLCDLLVLGSYAFFKELSKEIIALRNEDLGLKIARTIQNVSDYDLKTIEIGDKSFSLEKSYVIGILNVTPDSFSDGGKYYNVSAAIEHGLKMLDDGADIIDIGGESSRPGATNVNEEEELNRILPVLEEILKKKSGALISIDTTKSKVAYEALKQGAKLVNDISSFNFDKQILDVVRQFNAAYILMHMKGEPKSMQNNPYYDDVVAEIYDYLSSKVEIAKKTGIKNIIIDPGIGFGKRIMDNYELVKRLNEFKGIGQPILVGLSKKSFLGKALNIEIDEREDPTLVAESIAIKSGARFIRTHNVKKAKLAVQLNNFFDNPEILSNV